MVEDSSKPSQCDKEFETRAYERRQECKSIMIIDKNKIFFDHVRSEKLFHRIRSQDVLARMQRPERSE